MLVINLLFQQIQACDAENVVPVAGQGPSAHKRIHVLRSSPLYGSMPAAEAEWRHCMSSCLLHRKAY